MLRDETVRPSLTALLTRLAAPPRLYRQFVDRVEQPQRRRGRRYWIVSRGLCRFLKIPLVADAPVARQLEALNLQIKRLSPFADTAAHVHHGVDFVSIWLWDREATRRAAEAIDVDLRRVRVLPETVLRPAGDEGVQLVEALDGVEGQSWIDGGLAASHWWPAPPDARAWGRFLRGTAGTGDPRAAAPPALRLGWLDRPWSRTRSSKALDFGNIDLRLAASAIAAVFLVLYAYLGAEWLRLVYDIDATAAAITTRSAASEATVAARTAALDDLARIESLRALDQYPSALAVMARVAESLPKNETHLKAWNYERGQLEMTVAADHPLDARFFVQALERIEGFKNVAAQRADGDNSLNIRLSIDPK